MDRKAEASEIRDAIRRSQAGDREAFEHIYKEYAGRVHALCLRLAGERDRSEILTQDAFVRAWERLGSYAHKGSFSAWLLRVAARVVVDDFRRRRREKDWLVELNGEEMGALHGCDITFTATHSVLSQAKLQPIENSLRIDLERAIAALPAGARTVFVLHDVHGFRGREIAETIGIAIGTVKSHLFRARRLLRHALAPARPDASEAIPR